MSNIQVFARQGDDALSSDPNIGVDLDGVMADFNDLFLRQINQKFGTEWQKHHITEYDYHKCILIQESEVYQHFDEMVVDGSYAELLQMPGAQLANMLPGRVNLVTNRMAATKDDTLKWLDKHGIFHFETLTFVKGSKRQAFEHFGSFDYFIEDSLKNALDVAPLVKEIVFLIDHPYNQADSLPANIMRVTGWTEIMNYFISKYVD